MTRVQPTVASVDDANDPIFGAPPGGHKAWSTNRKAKTRRKRLNREKKKKAEERTKDTVPKTPSKSYCASVTNLMSPGGQQQFPFRF
jgi:septal ring factor EnvC (AmiA/AmiB activator)